ncbi:hypothetical protein [Lysobacter solisilvae (ex Woo and Kim 2020)]|uniref:DUF4148 domain-containing protein n=1 Tax=Agrilutibacter terrestris TaxID=2865112 RepID=A0A7H0FVH9_9GAMM|nr:hypothetical protein [Lysobacter terrestris]QNP40045.1 hypothetical protein H8B22_11120 [Lysobacter terrestris]
MKLRMAVLSASVACLAACASSGGTASNSPAAHKTYPETRLSNDELYMARVEAAALRRGIGLQWVNPPRKIVAKQD